VIVTTAIGPVEIRPRLVIPRPNGVPPKVVPALSADETQSPGSDASASRLLHGAVRLPGAQPGGTGGLLSLATTQSTMKS
jgi:hypothetical protein